MFVFLFVCMSQLVNFSVFVSLWLGTFSSAIHSISGHILVLFFTGSDVTINITAHIAKYTPKGRLHGNHKVSLSRGFVKCNIIQRGQGCHKRRDISVAQCCWKNLLFSTLCPQMSLIQITTESTSACYIFLSQLGLLVVATFQGFSCIERFLMLPKEVVRELIKPVYLCSITKNL